jgi:hypothetical protein
MSSATFLRGRREDAEAFERRTRGERLTALLPRFGCRGIFAVAAESIERFIADLRNTPVKNYRLFRAKLPEQKCGSVK